MKEVISNGTIHKTPADLNKALASNPQVLSTWEDITPLARNEWICWIESAKKSETRAKRIKVGCEQLAEGKMLNELKRVNVYMKTKWKPY